MWLLWLAGACVGVGGVNAPRSCSGVDVAAWTSPSRQFRGYHVLCIGDPCAHESSAEYGDCDANADISIRAYWDGVRDGAEFGSKRPTKLLEVEEMVIAQHRLSHRWRYERLRKGILKKKKKAFSGLFGFFAVRHDDHGFVPRRIKSAGDFHGLILAYEGGQFLWPGIEIGFTRNVTLQPTAADDKALDLRILTKSLQPLVVEISSFLSEDDSQHIISKALPHIAESQVAHMDHDVEKPDSEWRTSSQHFLTSDDETLHRIDRQISALTNVKQDHQEDFQVLRYNVGEQYGAHTDYFDPRNYANNEEIISMTSGGVFNRMATVFFYLTSVEEGGQTNFPRAGGLPQPHGFADCSQGVSIDPEAGRIIIFYSIKPDASFDPYSLHGGCKVLRGEKWSANKWIWNRRQV